MQHQVPQFIDIEDKIFGPLTAKQFFYVLGGGAAIFIMYVSFQLWLVIILGAPIVVFCGALAFLKINGRPFIKVLGAALGYATSGKLYLWKKINPPPTASPLDFKKGPGILAGGTPKLTQNKLQDLAWSLDVQQKLKR